MTTLLSAGMSDRFSHAQRSRHLSDESGLPQPLLNRRPSAEAIECPKCSKRSVVRRSSNIYDCINCSFHKELSPVATSAAFSTSQFSRHALSDSLPSPLSRYQRLPNGNLPLADNADGEKTHPLVFAALMVIVGILFL